MDDYLNTMLARALSAGLSFRMRLDEERGEATLYLRLVEAAGETTWAAAVAPDGDLEPALLTLFASCAQKIVEVGEREGVVPESAARPLPSADRFFEGP